MKSTSGVIAIAALVTGCTSMPPIGQTAVANLEATKGNTAAGTVTFQQQGNIVQVSARLTGLAPGAHGFHIHEKGDCSSGDGMSAGAHFNPLGKAHANPATENRHAGDMPMLNADVGGNATLQVQLDVITVGIGGTDVIGKSVIVHKDPDDFTTQPTGNSGARVTCGVIRRVR